MNLSDYYKLWEKNFEKIPDVENALNVIREYIEEAHAISETMGDDRPECDLWLSNKLIEGYNGLVGMFNHIGVVPCKKISID